MDYHLLHTEAYRKKSGNENDFSRVTNSPFDIGIIKEIRSNLEGDRVKIKFQNLRRPTEENHPNNLLYWTNLEKVIDALKVEGQCFVRHLSDEKLTIEQWSSEGENRFYYSEMFEDNRPKPLDSRAENLTKKYSLNVVEKDLCALPKVKKLRCLDIFAGAGGLSCGLHQAKIAETYWAIEFDESAAKAFKQNNPNTLVFNEDCNILLKEIIEAEKEGREAIYKNEKLLKKGEVELLCGGPPCQGFSVMNRFNQGEYSMFKNSLIATYLSVSCCSVLNTFLHKG